MREGAGSRPRKRERESLVFVCLAEGSGLLAESEKKMGGIVEQGSLVWRKMESRLERKNGRGEALVLAEKLQQGGRRLLKMEKKVMVLGLGFFLYFLLMLSKLQPPFCLSCEPVFIGKMLHGSQNWSLNFLSFFVKFDFS